MRLSRRRVPAGWLALAALVVLGIYAGQLWWRAAQRRPQFVPRVTLYEWMSHAPDRGHGEPDPARLQAARLVDIFDLPHTVVALGAPAGVSRIGLPPLAIGALLALLFLAPLPSLVGTPGVPRAPPPPQL